MCCEHATRLWFGFALDMNGLLVHICTLVKNAKSLVEVGAERLISRTVGRALTDQPPRWETSTQVGFTGNLALHSTSATSLQTEEEADRSITTVWVYCALSSLQNHKDPFQVPSVCSAFVMSIGPEWNNLRRLQRLLTFHWLFRYILLDA